MDAQVVPDDARCFGCGYSLVELVKPVCPECGRAFDPDDPSTYRCWFSPTWAHWARPPGTFEIALLIALSIWGLLHASGPGQWTSNAICIFPLIGGTVWTGLAFIYILRLDARRCARRTRKADPDTTRRRDRWRWFVAPICGLIVLSSLAYPWPLMLRFRLSLPAFERALEDARAGKSVGGAWVGLYYVKSVNVQALEFSVGGSALTPVGFKHDSTPGSKAGSRGMRVAPSWRTFEY